MDRWLTQLVMALLVAALTSGCAAKRKAKQVQAAVDLFEQNTQIDVHVYDSPKVVPPNMGDKFDLGPPEPDEVLRLLPTIEKVVLQYPTKLRTKRFHEMWLLGKLRFGAKSMVFNGLAKPGAGTLFIPVRSTTRAHRLEKNLHHEIAHMLEGMPGMDWATWRSVNTAGYAGKRRDATYKGNGPQHLIDGFVSRYASKNKAEDFAEMASVAFDRPDLVRQWHGEYPAIATKLELLTAQYQRVAPGMVLPWVDEGWRAWVAAERNRGDTGKGKRRGKGGGNRDTGDTGDTGGPGDTGG